MIHQQKLNLNPLQTMKYIVETRGIPGIFRGFASTAFREAVYTAGYLSLAPIFQRRFMQRPGWEDSFILSAIMGSCSAGVIAQLVSHPVDTAKTNVQADLKGEVYPTATGALFKLYKKDGIKQLYQGGLARTIRGCGAFLIVSSLREQCITNKTTRGNYVSFV